MKLNPGWNIFQLERVKQQENIVGKSKTKSSSTASKKKSLNSLKPINLNAAGIDIGADSHWVSVPADREDLKLYWSIAIMSKLYQEEKVMF
jgi:hypothetical protein